MPAAVDCYLLDTPAYTSLHPLRNRFHGHSRFFSELRTFVVVSLRPQFGTPIALSSIESNFHCLEGVDPSFIPIKYVYGSLLD